jgi:hypothetical protein
VRNPTLLRIATVAADRPACARLLAVAPAGRSTASYTITRDTTAATARLLAERGLDVSYETVRRSVLKFGPMNR